jgi:hypothetical protein
MKHFFIYAGLLLISFTSKAQTDTVYTERYLTKSTTFAATTIGADFLVSGGGTSTFIKNGSSKSADFSAVALPRLSIGGVHFWGHTEFYVNFPLPFLAIKSTPADFDILRYTQGVDCGLKLYPMALKPGRLSPYAGIGFRVLNFQQQLKDEKYKYKAPEFQKTVYPLQVGLTYTTNKYLFAVNGQYQPLTKFSYNTSPSLTGSIKVSPFSFQMSVSKYFDSDKNLRRKEFVSNENNKYKVLQKEKKLSSWYWGIGPSAGLQVSKSPFLQKYYPHLHNEFIGGFLPDITFGRFFNKQDMNMGISYRTMGNTIYGFDDKIRLRRHSFMLEAYKNLFNYLGFVPFAGVTGSVEKLSMNVNGTAYADTKPALGFIFGWDIRITKTGTSLLRTNMRYIPNLHLSINGEKMMFDQLEFNFIQWVQFIGRNKVYKKYRKTAK